MRIQNGLFTSGNSCQIETLMNLVILISIKGGNFSLYRAHGGMDGSFYIYA